MSFVSGDTASKLEVTCKDDDTGLVIDLAGSVVKLRWIDKTGTLQSKTMTVTDAANGVAEYQFAAADLTGTQLKFEVEITNVSSDVLHSIELIRENVREVLA